MEWVMKYKIISLIKVKFSTSLTNLLWAFRAAMQ